MKTEKLKELIDKAGITQYELAKRLNIAPTTVNQWFARNSVKDKYLIQICKVTGFDIKEFLGESDMTYNENKITNDEHEENNITSNTITNKQDDVVYIKRYKNISASAGHGEYINGVDVFEEDKPIPFSRAELPKDRDIAKLEAIKVKGVSMLPTFMPNDWVLFDRAVCYYDGDGLYVLNYAGNLIIKRLQFDMSSNSMEIISDNPQYKNYYINLTENQENLNIIGAVLFKIQKEL